MNYIFDTSIIIDIRRGNSSLGKYLKQNLDLSGAKPHITLMTFSEYYFGAIPAGERGKSDCIEFLNIFDHLSISKNAAILFAELTYNYKKKGISFGTMDLLNASIAVDQNMIFVTRDKIFEEIRELKKIIIKNKNNN